MNVTKNYILNSLGLNSLADATPIHLYRVYKNKFSHEEAFINFTSNWTHTGNAPCVRGMCARYDNDGKIATAKIDPYQGVIYTNGGSTNVWFLDESEELAKALLIEDYEQRIRSLKDRISKFEEVLDELSKS